MLPTVGLAVLLAAVAAPVATLDARQAWTSPIRQPGGNSARWDGYQDGRIWSREGPDYNRAAITNGYDDGYREGLNDGRRRHRNDPFAERRYRNADHGYERWFGSREAYRVEYREGFRNGDERGYRDGLYRRW